MEISETLPLRGQGGEADKSQEGCIASTKVKNMGPGARLPGFRFVFFFLID